jgi:type IV fimbrial biogenesis protein FimT
LDKEVHMHRQSGQTLIELIFVTAIAALLGTFALPSLRAWLLDARHSSRTTAFVVSALLARSESLRRAHPVTLCASDDGRRCGEDFAKGWIVFEDQDRDGERQAAEPLLDAYETQAGGKVRSTRPRFVWRPHGRRSTNGTVTFCSPTPAGRSRAVIVSYTGRPRTSDRLSEGERLDC